MARYWVVSANVNGPRHQNKLPAWIKIILNNHSVYMGYDSETSGGRVFAEMSKNDVVLIEHGNRHQLVACGRVTSNKRATDPRVEGLGHSQFATLDPFEPLDEDPKRNGISFKATSYDGAAVARAIFELRRDDTRRTGDAKLCDWLDQKLERGKGRAANARNSLPTMVTVRLAKADFESDHEGYDVCTKERRFQALLREKKLVREFTLALRKQGRETSTCVYCTASTVLCCDVYEQKKRHLIEAKASCRREDIRMAIGQLFDYNYLAEAAGRGRSKLAILVPDRPPKDVEQLLDSIGIASIWQKNNRFADNRTGRFV